MQFVYEGCQLCLVQLAHILFASMQQHLPDIPAALERVAQINLIRTPDNVARRSNLHDL